MVATTKGKNMNTLIHCPECGEDTNVADWLALRNCCAHCGAETHPVRPRVHRGLVPLVRLRKRLALEMALQKEPVYV
jgi:rRNA maturation protein Nop10